MEQRAPLSESEFLVLQQLDLESRGMLCSILTLHGDEHLTVCPVCGNSDFIHHEGCRLAREGEVDFSELWKAQHGQDQTPPAV